MKISTLNKIPTIVLVACLVISAAIFGIFGYAYINETDLLESVELSLLLDWMYFMLGITLAAVFIGMIWSYLKNR